MSPLNPSYLDTSSGDWAGCLLSSYGFLRHSWQTKWIGLPQIIKYCAEYLKLDTNGEQDHVNTLLNAAMAVANQIESEIGYGIDTAEPAYHNRLHFADSLTTISLQCKLEVQNGAKHDHAWQTALLLIAVAHDFRHPGHINRHVSDIESTSVKFLIPILKGMNISALWIERIANAILRSDFTLVKENHSRVQGTAFGWNNEWAAVLLNEADVMASASADFGPSLSSALSLEWQAINFPAYATVATEPGRRQFLSSIQFSSYSGRILSAGVLTPT